MIPGERYREELAGKWGHGGGDGEADDSVSTSWEYAKTATGKHRDTDEVWAKLSETLHYGYNLLLNVGFRPDGRLDPDDAEPLQSVGERIESDGFSGESSPDNRL